MGLELGPFRRDEEEPEVLDQGPDRPIELITDRHRSSCAPQRGQVRPVINGQLERSINLLKVLVQPLVPPNLADLLDGPLEQELVLADLLLKLAQLQQFVQGDETANGLV